jgi:hypothetical protein
MNDVLNNKADGDKIVSVELTKSQCVNVAEFIGFGLIDRIRNDPYLDNVLWIADMVEALKTLEKAGGVGND